MCEQSSFFSCLMQEAKGTQRSTSQCQRHVACIISFLFAYTAHFLLNRALWLWVPHSVIVCRTAAFFKMAGSSLLADFYLFIYFPTITKIKCGLLTFHVRRFILFSLFMQSQAKLCWHFQLQWGKAVMLWSCWPLPAHCSLLPLADFSLIGRSFDDPWLPAVSMSNCP